MARGEGPRGMALFDEWGDPGLSYRLFESLDFIEGAAFTLQEYEDIAKTLVSHGNYPSFPLDIRLAKLAGLVERVEGGQFVPRGE